MNYIPSNLGGIAAAPWELELAKSLGLTLSVLRFVVACFASVPLGGLLGKLPYGTPRHLYAFLSGLLLIIYPFGYDVYKMFIPALVVYAAMRLTPRHAGSVAWLVAFPYLIYCHIAAASAEVWKQGHMDYTGAAMVMTLKLISSAVNVSLAQRDLKHLSDEDRHYRIAHRPSLLGYLGYLACCGNLLSGPHMELRDYLSFTAGKDEFAMLSKPGAPRALLPTLRKLLISIASMLIYLVGSMYTPTSLLEARAFHTCRLPNVLYKFLLALPAPLAPVVMKGMCSVRALLLIWAVCSIYRFKFYFAWGLGDASLTASGFGYEGGGEAMGAKPLDPSTPASHTRSRTNGGNSDNNSNSGERGAKWDRGTNMHILDVEFSTSGRAITQHWNLHTGKWLRRYCYDRLTFHPLVKAQRLLITQLVCAVWHGIFPGYWLFFGTSALMFETATVLFKYEQAALLKAPKLKGLFKVMLIIMTQIHLNYIASSFIVINWAPAMQVFKTARFLGHISMVSIMIVSKLVPPPRPSDSKKRE